MQDADAVAVRLRHQHGIINRQQALDCGLSARQITYRVRAGVWYREARGVYRHRLFRPTWRSRLLVACFELNAVASHRSAAALHRIEDFPPGRVEVVVASGRWRRPPAVTVHQSTQTDRLDTALIDAIPCAGLTRTVLDLAAVTDRSRLEAAIDFVLRERGVDLVDLSTVLARHSRRGRDGCGKLRAVLDERLGRSGIPLSRWSRMVGELLVSGGIPAPVYEHVVTDDAGRFLGQADLAYPAARVAIELDSVSWHLNRESFEKDPQRRNRLTVAGWVVLNYTWRRTVDDAAGVRREVAAALRRSPF